MGTCPQFTPALDPAVLSIGHTKTDGIRRARGNDLPAPRDRGTAGDEPRLDVFLAHADDVLVATIHGDLVGRTTGILKEALREPISDGTRKLIVELSAVRTVTRAGLGGLIVASKLMQVDGGSLRICGADREAAKLLSGLHLDHLIRLDGSHQDSLNALSEVGSRFDPVDTALSMAEIFCWPSRQREDRS